MNSECGSDQRTLGIESYVWFRRLWRSVSQRRMPRETEKHKEKRSFIPSNVDSRCKSDNGKGMKRGHKEDTQKQKGKESPLCCIDGHPPHPKVRVHPRECSQKQLSSVENPFEAADVNGEKHSQPRHHRGAVHKLHRRSMESGTRAITVHCCAKGRELR